MTFEEWWESQTHESKYETRTQWDGYRAAESAWQASQQAERERILKIVAEVDKQEFVDDDWYSCCATIVERIKNDV